MKLRTLLGGCALVGLTALVTSQVVSQETGAKQADKEAEMWAKMARYGTPGKAHKRLEPLVGHWTYTIEMWEYPGAEGHKDSGTVETEWILGGRFLLQHVLGDGPMPDGSVFEGYGCLGYDNFREEYTSVWISNMGTSISTNTGKVDAAGKMFTFRGMHDDVMTGERDKPMREVMRIIDQNNYTSEWYQKDANGKEFLGGKLVFTRKEVDQPASFGAEEKKTMKQYKKDKD